MTYIGLDLGTSSLKAILMDDGQSVLAEHSIPLSVTRPQPGWSEQDPAPTRVERTGSRPMDQGNLRRYSHTG